MANCYSKRADDVSSYRGFDVLEFVGIRPRTWCRPNMQLIDRRSISESIDRPPTASGNAPQGEGRGIFPCENTYAE